MIIFYVMFNFIAHQVGFWTEVVTLHWDPQSHADSQQSIWQEPVGNTSQYLDEQVEPNQRIIAQAADFHDRQFLMQSHAKIENITAVIWVI